MQCDISLVFFFNDTATTEIYTLSLHDALPILSQATFTGDRIQVPFGKEQVKSAPQIDADGELSPEEEEELYRYYGLSTGSGDRTGYETTTGVADRTGYETTTGVADRTGADRATVGRDTSGPTTDDAMTRSEERLTAETRTEEAGRARLRKYVVTEQQQVSV